jgi:hypothetical protein
LKKEYNNDEWDGTIEGLNDRVSTVEEAKSDDS